MPMILKFFENITKVTLPSFIDKLINGDLPDDFKYDYFKENPKEIVFHRSICFSIDDFFAILSNMEKCQNILFNNERSYLAKTFKILNSEENKKLIETLRNIDEYEFIFDRKRKKEKKRKKILNYFLFSDILVNNEYVKIFEINQKSPNFIIKEMRIFQNEKDNQTNSIIRAKNYLSSLLYNYRPLVKTDFDEGTTQNTIKILNELKKFMKSSNFVMDEILTSELHINSLIDRLKLLPTDFQLNDFENLFKSFECDIINSINEIDFETMSICFGKVKFSNRIKIYYENAKKSIFDLELNEKVKSIIEKEPICSIISLRYTEKEKEFKIEKGKNTEEMPVFDIFKNVNEEKIICPTIESFAYKFPDISKIQQLQDVDLFKLDCELKFTNELYNYFKLIKEYINKQLSIYENL